MPSTLSLLRDRFRLSLEHALDGQIISVVVRLLGTLTVMLVVLILCTFSLLREEGIEPVLVFGTLSTGLIWWLGRPQKIADVKAVEERLAAFEERLANAELLERFEDRLARTEKELQAQEPTPFRRL